MRTKARHQFASDEVIDISLKVEVVVFIKVSSDIAVLVRRIFADISIVDATRTISKAVRMAAASDYVCIQDVWFIASLRGTEIFCSETGEYVLLEHSFHDDPSECIFFWKGISLFGN